MTQQQQSQQQSQQPYVPPVQSAPPVYTPSVAPSIPSTLQHSVSQTESKNIALQKTPETKLEVVPPRQNISSHQVVNVSSFLKFSLHVSEFWLGSCNACPRACMNFLMFSLVTKMSSLILFVEFFIIAVKKIKNKIKKITENFFIIYFQNSQFQLSDQIYSKYLFQIYIHHSFL